MENCSDHISDSATPARENVKAAPELDDLKLSTGITKHVHL